jgi:hypothetical protein
VQDRLRAVVRVVREDNPSQLLFRRHGSEERQPRGAESRGCISSDHVAQGRFDLRAACDCAGEAEPRRELRNELSVFRTGASAGFMIQVNDVHREIGRADYEQAQQRDTVGAAADAHGPAARGHAPDGG